MNISSNTFVGRQHEMDELIASLEHALSGRGRLVMLVGEPGIGKTRTATELASIAEGRGAQVWWGRCYEGEGAPPYWPWVQPIRAYIQQMGANQLRFEMGQGAADIAQIVPEVHDKLPGLDPIPSLEPVQARFRLFDSIAAFLKNASQSQPIVLVLDDLHWADRSSLLLLEFLSNTMANSRLLILGTYRDVEVTRRHPLSQSLGTLVREPLFLSIELGGLNEGEVNELAESAGGVTLESSLLNALYSRTEGNPLFVGEIMKLMEREGDGADWDIRIPTGIRDVIGRRLDRLSDECNQVLTTASVVGRGFGLELLERLMEGLSTDRLMDVLDEAMSIGVIEEIRDELGRYQFSHALIQQTLSEELSATRRVRLHARIAQALEKLYADDLQTHVDELAFHFAQAERMLGMEKLARYSLIAGEGALASFAYEEALIHFEQALAAKEYHPMDAETAAILFGVGQSQLFLGAWEEALANLETAFEYFVEARDIPHAVAVATLFFPENAFYRQLELIAGVLEFVPPDSIESARLLSKYGQLLGRELGDYEGAQRAINEALTIARREGDTFLEMWTLERAASIDCFQLHWEQSLRKALDAIELAPHANNPQAHIAATWHVVTALAHTGNLREAERHTSAGMASAEKLRMAWRLSVACWAVEMAASLRGDWQTERDSSDRLKGQPAANNWDVSRLSTRMLLEFQAGEFDEAELFMEQMLEALPRMPKREWFYLLPGVVIVLTNQISGNADHSDLAQVIIQDTLSGPHVSPSQSLMGSVGLGLMALQAGDHADALEQYSALKSFPRTIVPYSLISLDRVLGLLAHFIGRLDEAASHFEEALAFCTQGYRPELAWTCCDYANMLVDRNAHGDREKAAELLDEAFAISDELGMKPLNARVTELQTKVLEAASPLPTEFSATYSTPLPQNMIGGTYTIMFTDIENSTLTSERLGDEGTQEWLGAHNTIVRQQVAAHNGHEIRFQGDGFVLAFSSASDGLRCAKAIQYALSVHNRQNTGEPIPVRMGLHTGEVTWDKDDLYGRTMVLAARISSEAKGGQILVSGLLRELASSRREFDFSGERQLELKGLSGLQTVFELMWEESP